MKHLFHSVGTQRTLPICGSAAAPLEKVPSVAGRDVPLVAMVKSLGNVLSPQEVISPQERQHVGPRLPRTRTLGVQKISGP